MKYLVMIAMMAALVLNACSGGGASTKKENKMPKWISKPGQYEDAIIAAGIGEGLSEQKAKSQAEQSGRKKIAETIQSQIKSLTTNFMEEATTSTDKGSESAAQEYFQEVTQSLTNVTLSGAVIEEYWPPMGEKNGNKIKFYAKVVLKKNSFVDEFKKKVQEDVAAKKIKGVKASADDALKALDKAVAKWEGTAEKGGDDEE
ncbi:LPP20 family lipoprotein [bacterium]|nr:LPP20 family lipoprotein [bacterium]